MAVVLVVSFSWNSVWLTKLRYVATERMDYSEIRVVPRPKDCDFMQSPLGRKSCTYERRTSLVHYGHENGTARPTFSIDGGKNWRYSDTERPDGRMLVVTWWKVDRR